MKAILEFCLCVYVCVCVCVCVRVHTRSVISDSFLTLWTVASQDPLSLGFPWQEY